MKQPRKEPLKRSGTTTMRIRTDLHQRLRLIAEAERKTLYEITDMVIENYVVSQEMVFGILPKRPRK